MNWLNGQPLKWIDPLTFTAPYAGTDMALLYSGMAEGETGHTSYLFLDPVAVREGSGWHAFPPSSEDDPSGMLPDWVGYLGYGMREDQPRGSSSPVTLPDFRFIRYAHGFRFDHRAQTLTHFMRSSHPALHTAPPHKHRAVAPLRELASNFTRAQYESTIARTVAHIHNGDFYQANITRKFFGRFQESPDSWSLFSALTAASPAPYSAYIRHGQTSILSASPECFLSVDASGAITTRPIKGSARRGATPEEDNSIRRALQASPKNNAENLMIVDLMRNDLARTSLPESVAVAEQSGLYSYATIHHLISTIHAQKRPDISTAEVMRTCFPPGSMTGAPKIAAMRWCADAERQERGVYSGAIGWLGAGDSCDLSVVIRTLILEGDRFEFQVGGGIVADSTPEDEWRETLIKARGIAAALGIMEEDLASL